MDNKIRLQKLIAEAGICSRRKAEEFIAQGMVSVNGRTVTEMGTKVDPQKDIVRIEGRQISIKPKKTTLLLYKPKGYITSMSDPQGRPTIRKFVDKIPFRLFPIGRLDFNTEGLLLITNDGDLAQALSHPKHKIEKIYLVKVQKIPTKQELQQLRKGVKLEDGKTAPCQVSLISSTKSNCWLEIVLTEGKNRQIRRMLEAIGYNVLKLRRVGIAFLTPEGLAPGDFRELSTKEIQALKKLSLPPRPKKS